MSEEKIRREGGSLIVDALLWGVTLLAGLSLLIYKAFFQ